MSHKMSCTVHWLAMCTSANCTITWRHTLIIDNRPMEVYNLCINIVTLDNQEHIVSFSDPLQKGVIHSFTYPLEMCLPAFDTFSLLVKQAQLVCLLFLEYKAFTSLVTVVEKSTAALHDISRLHKDLVLWCTLLVPHVLVHCMFNW